jgi:hypothetical protein
MHEHDHPAVPLPPAYHVRDRELPQRLLGILLWTGLVLVLWTFGAR